MTWKLLLVITKQDCLKVQTRNKNPNNSGKEKVMSCVNLAYEQIKIFIYYIRKKRKKTKPYISDSLMTLFYLHEQIWKKRELPFILLLTHNSVQHLPQRAITS